MGKKQSGKGKNTQKLPEIVKIENVSSDGMIEDAGEVVAKIESVPITEGPILKTRDPFPDRPLLRVSEVASYYDVTDRTVYLWLEHGHLSSEKTPGGQTRVTKQSVMDCKFRT
jgi:excisionase family DNA binding protein